MIEIKQPHFLKSARVFGVLSILLLLVSLVLQVLAISWAETRSGNLAWSYQGKIFFIAVALVFVGYYKTGAIGENIIAVRFFKLAMPLFLVSLFFSSSSELGAIILIGFMFFVPFGLVFLALREMRVDLWKCLVPLSIPIFMFIAMTLRKNYPIGGIIIYVGIGLVAVVALLGKKEVSSYDS